MNPKYSEEFKQKPLSLKLFDDYDTKEEILWKKQLEALANNKITPCELPLNLTQQLFKKPSRNFNHCFSIKTLKISLLEKMLRGFQACAQLHPIPAEILSTLWIDSTVVL